MLWSRATCALALMLLGYVLSCLPLYLGWLVTSWEDVGGNGETVWMPGGLALLLGLVSWCLRRAARRRG